jgi:pSer/pThr/pTyr-binding forkhead associated (FHA) protein
MPDPDIASNAAAGARPAQDQPSMQDQDVEIVLEPLSHPELGEIDINDTLFAIGRTELPFASYPAQLIGELSRRHARIFSEHGIAYIADLGSKNGTTVNGVDIRQKTSMLHEGDEIGLGHMLRYRVSLRKAAQPAGKAPMLASLTLTPQDNAGGLQPIVITSFPFLIGKAESAFARYRDAHPQQLDYLSRRHAHIFLKAGAPFVEDLGSTNGTFVNGKRLAEHAHKLEDGAKLAFGGLHFVYTVSLQQYDAELELAKAEATVTRLAQAPAAAPRQDIDPERTTFVTAAESFLNIFCVTPPPPDIPQTSGEVAAPDQEAKAKPGKRQGHLALLASGLLAALRSDEPKKPGRRFLALGAVAAAIGGFALALIFARGGPEQQVRELMAGGDHAQAATVAGQYLERHSGNETLRALATEAALKAHLPAWLARLKSRDFAGAEATLAGMAANKANADLQTLTGELGWIGRIEKFMAPRAAADAPIRIYSDEEQIHTLLDWWNRDTAAHQRMLTRVASIVPEFNDVYASALSHLRRLQSDDAVYLAAIERLKAAIAAELKRDRLDAIEPLLKETVAKYPRLAGLEPLRRDLSLYLEIESAARARRLAPLAALLRTARFATPPFQAKFQQLAASGVLPPAQVLKQYAPVSTAWQAGDAQQAYARLQDLSGGPWAAEAAADLAHKKAVVEQFTALQKGRGTPGQEERVLAFYGSLDPLDDGYFIRAAEQGLGLDRGKALKQAQDRMARAETLWRQYRDNGGIEGRERLDSVVSDRFRSQARLLGAAQEAVQQGARTAGQLRAEVPEQWSRMQQDILAEASLQRGLLQDARGALDPGVLKAKLTLLGGQDNGERPRPEAAR